VATLLRIDQIALDSPVFDKYYIFACMTNKIFASAGAQAIVHKEHFNRYFADTVFALDAFAKHLAAYVSLGENDRRNSRQEITTYQQTIYRALGALEQYSNCTLEVKISASEIFEDFCALDKEFPGTFRADSSRVCFTTEPIVLCGVNLGPFEMSVDTSRFGRNYCASDVVWVQAKEPVNPQSGSHYTHPHVSPEDICLGEAATLINNAAKDGRIYDLFTVLCQWLRTYNEQDPYVQIEEWTHTRCPRCEYFFNDGDYNVKECSKCGSNVCPKCDDKCFVCGKSFCTACIRTCYVCSNVVCVECSPKLKCNRCSYYFCPKHIEDGVCKSCKTRDEKAIKYPAVGGAEAGCSCGRCQSQRENATPVSVGFASTPVTTGRVVDERSS